MKSLSPTHAGSFGKLPLDEWAHVAVVWRMIDTLPDRTLVHIYVDGTPPHFTNGGPTDGVTYTGGGGGGGTGHIILIGGASDEDVQTAASGPVCTTRCRSISRRPRRSSATGRVTSR